MLILSLTAFILVHLVRIDQFDGIVVRASALQLVNLGFNSLVRSHQKTKKWYSQLSCLVLGI